MFLLLGLNIIPSSLPAPLQRCKRVGNGDCGQFITYFCCSFLFRESTPLLQHGVSPIGDKLQLLTSHSSMGSPWDHTSRQQTCSSVGSSLHGANPVIFVGLGLTETKFIYPQQPSQSCAVNWKAGKVLKTHWCFVCSWAALAHCPCCLPSLPSPHQKDGQDIGRGCNQES